MTRLPMPSRDADLDWVACVEAYIRGDEAAIEVILGTAPPERLREMVIELARVAAVYMMLDNGEDQAATLADLTETRRALLAEQTRRIST